MDFPANEVIGATATVLVAALGYRQWQRGRRSVQYLAERERAYKAIWDALESTNLFVRGSDYSREGFRERMRTANALVLTHGLYFEASDTSNVDRYLVALKVTGELLATDRADRAFVELRDAMYTTGAGVDVSALVPAYRGALVELDESRTLVIRTFQQRIGRPYA